MILNLEILAGVAKGLTRSMEGGGIIDDETDPDSNSEVAAIKRAREEPRAIALRENIFAAIRGVVENWSLDAEVSHVRPPPSPHQIRKY